jgi:hypothetical protein
LGIGVVRVCSGKCGLNLGFKKMKYKNIENMTDQEILDYHYDWACCMKYSFNGRDFPKDYPRTKDFPLKSSALKYKGKHMTFYSLDEYVKNQNPIMNGAKYRIVYYDHETNKELKSMTKTVGPNWPIAKLRYSQLSEVWKKNHEWEFKK